MKTPAFELATGELHVFRAKAVVFATGGYGRMFRVTSNAHALTGDGPAVVWRRGIPLEDMEMFQFHPTGLARLGVLLSEAARGEGGIVLNSEGERFMERYAPTIKDLAPRDMVSRAIYQEIKEGRGGGPNGDWVYLDISHLVLARQPASLIAQLRGRVAHVHISDCDGTVHGDVIVFGTLVTINGQVDDSVMGAAQTIVINGTVGHAVRVAAATLQVGSRARIGKDFMGVAAERAQHIDGGFIRLGQGATVANAHHLRAARLVCPLLTRDMFEINGMRRIADVDDRGAVRLRHAGHRINGVRYRRRAAVMADISDPAIALFVDRRLIGTAPLEVVLADEPYIERFRRVADLRRVSACHAAPCEHEGNGNGRMNALQDHGRLLKLIIKQVIYPYLGGLARNSSGPLPPWLRSLAVSCDLPHCTRSVQEPPSGGYG